MESNEEISHLKEGTILLSQPVGRKREAQARQPRTPFWCEKNTATVKMVQMQSHNMNNVTALYCAGVILKESACMLRHIMTEKSSDLFKP